MDTFARIIADSISQNGDRITTIHMRYWRGIHAELMTHRAFSRNARSSRAVPIAKMIEEVEKFPFVPKHWGKNQKGMQATEECNERVIIEKPCAVDTWDHGAQIEFWRDQETREEAWIEASQQAVKFAKAFMEAGYHKQIVNRLLEPFMYIDTLVTATDWANFLALRDHKDAEPHIRDLAVAVREVMNFNTPQELSWGQWHLPYVANEELELWASDAEGDSYIEDAFELGKRISAARCARISYSPFDGNGSIAAELERYGKLVETWPVHASPVEHQATPDWYDMAAGRWANIGKHRNFHGWMQHRAFIPNETVFG